MSVVSKEKYERLKLLPEEYRSNEQREAIIDFERAEAQAPTLAQVRAAVRMHNTLTKNPSLVNSNPVAKQKLDEALKIIDQDRAYTSLMGGRVKDAYVQPVKRIPDDLNSQFNFNWKSAYENVKGEKLRDTEADYDKLQKFIESNMYKEGDPNVNLQKIAYDMHMYNPNTMKWTEFINSEQGEEFKKYIKDVEKNQRTARIKDIFDNESNWLVDFTLPVSKEYAKQQLLEGKDPEMGLPLAADFATNALMFGGNKAAMVGAPVVKNAGDYAFNNVDPAVAGINTMLGVGTNILTPYAIQRGSKYFVKPGEEYSNRATVQGIADNMATKIGKLETEIKNGRAVPIKKGRVLDSDAALQASVDGTYDDIIAYKNFKDHIIYTDHPELFANQTYKTKILRKEKPYEIKAFSSRSHNKQGVVPEAEFQEGLDHQKILRYLKPSDNKKAEKLRQQTTRMFNAATNSNSKGYDATRKIMKDALDKFDKTGKLDNMTLKELYALGYNPKESFFNFVARKTPDLLKNYTTNFLGRGAGAGSTMTIPNLIAGQNLNEILKDKKEKKPTISEIFGSD